MVHSLEVEERRGRPVVLGLEKGEEDKPWYHLHIICEDEEAGDQHESPFCIKSIDMSGFPGTFCSSKKKKKKEKEKVAGWFHLNQCSEISVRFSTEMNI